MISQAGEYIASWSWTPGKSKTTNPPPDLIAPENSSPLPTIAVHVDWNSKIPQDAGSGN